MDERSLDDDWDWAFETHDRVTKPDVGDSPVYYIDRRLLNADTGNPYYYVSDERNRDVRLFSAGPLEDAYEVIDE